MKRINGLLNQMTMYQVVPAALFVLWFAALIGTLFGFVSFSPVALLASTLVLVGVSIGANKLFGWLFGVATHMPSAIITAFILVLIVTPKSNVENLAYIAILALIAQASKYLLAVRGRHIFNPAAVAVVITGALGIVYGSWWIATPPLIPLTLVLALFVLHKVRKVRVGVVFIAIATAGVVITQLIYGDGWERAISTAALSWPTLFLAGFMLTEPLTSPPRRWQQYVVAAVVGILCAVPFHIAGPVAMTPQLALVVGNGLAFWYGQRRAVKLTFKSREKLAGDIYEYRFSPVVPLRFAPGQYLELTLSHKGADRKHIRRMFSIVSSPVEDEVMLATRLPEQGRSTFKQRLASLHAGEVVSATGIAGDFILPPDTSTPLLFVAGGIGITPFVSMLCDLRSRGEERDITLVYSVRDAKQAAYLDELSRHPINRVLVCDDVAHISAEMSQWRVMSHNEVDVMINEISDSSNRTTYISGPPQMVDEWRAKLKANGAEHIKTDYFSGY